MGEGRSTVFLVGLALILALLMVGPLAPPAHTTTTFTVNSTADLNDLDFPGGVFDGTSNGRCDAVAVGPDVCTLRAAIQEANITAGVDAIAFNIFGSGVQSITPNSPLPLISDTVIIDGYTQPGASPNTLAAGDNAVIKVDLNGAKAGTTADGLRISNSNAFATEVQGLAINQFEGNAISVQGTSFVRVEGNFIGTNPSGTSALGNGFVGVRIDSGGINGGANVVGGASPGSRNVISGNDVGGVFIFDSDNNRVLGNYIGTDETGNKDLGNSGVGVSIFNGSNENTVGGVTAGARNVISGNDGIGVSVFLADNNRVLGNRIGTTRSGSGALGNSTSGVATIGSENNTVGDGTAGGLNTIAFNGADGVRVDTISGPDGANGNRILRDSIFSNGAQGIDLEDDGRTTNDAGDPDEGANHLQNFPVLSSAKTVSGKTTIKGTLNSNPNEIYKVQFFYNPSGTNEGKTFIGQQSVTTNGSGNVSFAFSPSNAVAVGKTITATATKDFTGETSEFSAPRTVTSF